MASGIIGIVLVVVASIIALSVSVHNYNYSAARADLENEALTVARLLKENGAQNRSDYFAGAADYAESYEDSDKTEVQFIDTKGRVVSSSSASSVDTSPAGTDIPEALQSGETAFWQGREAGVRRLSVSVPLEYADGKTAGVVRFLTNTARLDQKVLRLALLSSGIGLIIIVIVLFSNMYFIRTILEPIDELTKSARQISEGSYGIQTEKKYDDEIGELTDAINEMSSKISQSERMQTEFISSVSHELRTPLTAITGWSETLMYDPEIKGDSQRGVAIISKEAARLTKMVEELLEFTRIQDGRFNLSIEQLDIEAELEDSIFAYGELLRQMNMELEYKPSSAPIPLIPGDPERLRQVFLNILDNASKYGRDGNVIEVSLEKQGDYVIIKVRDHGTGIPPAELPFVKKKFYKGSSKERGSGIGLAVCDEIITRHGGDLIIANAEGGGVCVTIRLPVVR